MPERRKQLKTAQLIGISGKQYSGKDLLASLLQQHLPQFHLTPIAFAIKQAYAQQRQMDLATLEAHKAEHRPGLIALGNWGRQQDPDYWLRQVLSLPGPKIISDVRLMREYELLKQQGAYLIRLNASRDTRLQRGHLVSEDDPTECELDTQTDWDAVLSNNGTVAEFEAQVDTL